MVFCVTLQSKNKILINYQHSFAMTKSVKTGIPTKYHTMEERIEAFKKAVGLRKEWEECSRQGITYEQMVARGVKPLRFA